VFEKEVVSLIVRWEYCKYFCYFCCTSVYYKALLL